MTGRISGIKNVASILGAEAEQKKSVAETLGFVPRPQQIEILENLQKHKTNIVVAHRRMGKSIALIYWLFLRGLTDPVRSAAQPRKYMFCAPTIKQAREIADDAIKNFGVAIGAKLNKAENKCYMPNGAIITLAGSSRPDTLRGSYLDGLVIDEYAFMNLDFDKILSPQLKDYDGFVIFSSTPNGRNAFYHKFQEAKGDKDYGVSYMPIKKSLKLFFENANKNHRENGEEEIEITDKLLEESMEKVRGKQDKDSFAQEYHLNFNASVEGAYFANQLKEAHARKSIRRVDFMPNLPVYTGWDIGLKDATAIWFFPNPKKQSSEFYKLP